MKVSRRRLLMGAAGGAAVLAASKAQAGSGPKRRFPGVLVDATQCVGCRACEAACAEVNGLPPPAMA